MHAFQDSSRTEENCKIFSQFLQFYDVSRTCWNSRMLKEVYPWVRPYLSNFDLDMFDFRGLWDWLFWPLPSVCGIGLDICVWSLGILNSFAPTYNNACWWFYTNNWVSKSWRLTTMDFKRFLLSLDSPLVSFNKPEHPREHHHLHARISCDARQAVQAFHRPAGATHTLDCSGDGKQYSYRHHSSTTP